MVTATLAASGAAMRAAKPAGLSATRFAASRLVRFPTGSSRLAVFASSAVVIANGSSGSPTRAAIASMIGVSSTAVVSRLRPTVVTTAISTQSAKSRL